MSGVLRHTMTFAWAALIGATLIVFALAEGSGFGRPAAVAIVLIAAFKVRMVFLWFMELNSAAMPWRAIAEIWVLLVTTVLIGGLLLTPTP